MPRTSAVPICFDPKASLDSRLDDLMSHLTIDDMIGGMGDTKIGSFKVPPMWYGWSETLHGLARHGVATVFPQAIGLAATFNTRLMHSIATAISDEVRAKYHRLTRPGEHPFVGLLCGAPVVNIARDPRWGRTQETYGEDPVLSGAMARAYVTGLQGDDPNYLKVVACAKHFAVHSGPEGLRHRFDARVSTKDLHETYLPAFCAAIKAGAMSVMSAYNRVNGVPASASGLLLKKILRETWGFQGYVVPDYGAIHDIWRDHKVCADHVEAVAASVRNGTDTAGWGKDLREALKRGLLSEEDIRTAFRNRARASIRLGLFDNVKRNPYAKIPLSVVACPAHRALSLRAAEQSIVLLKNNGVLPLKPQVRTIFVTGPGAADIDLLLGNYHGYSARCVTPLEGIIERAGLSRKVNYGKGCCADRDIVNERQITTDLAGGSEVTIAIMGYNPLLEGEEYDPFMSDYLGDRRDIGLPAHQIDYVKQLRAKCGDKPLILVLTGGSAIAIPELHDIVDAVIQLWYPGEQGGTALARVLFGDVSPSGRMPVTVPCSTRDLPTFENYSMVNRTYRFAQKAPLYPFGFGLSYSSFAYKKLSLSRKTVARGQSLACTCTVINTGAARADEVVQMYISDCSASVRVPRYELKAFKRLSLRPGVGTTVRFVITPDMLELVTNSGKRVAEPGAFTVYIGGACPHARTVELGGAKPVSAEFALVDTDL
jgi:beta-glucosidase